MVKIKSPFPFWGFLCVIVTALILWLALMSSDSAPSGLGWDKLNHAGAMALITGLAFLSVQSCSWAVVAAFLYSTFLGVLIEILQATLTTSRTAEWGDVLADMIGAGCTLGAIRIFQSKLKFLRGSD